jgi:hypothetical protein
VEGRKTRSLVEQDRQEAAANQLEGRPVFSFNGMRLSGAHELSTFQKLIENELSG